NHSAIYEPIGDRMVVYGGTRGSGALDDLWSLSLGTLQWTKLDPPAPTPGGRTSHAAIFDPVRGRMVVFGCNGTCANPSEIWSLSLVGLPSWTKIVPQETRDLIDLNGCGAIYDPVHDAAVVGPTRVSGAPMMWQMPLSGLPRWTELQPNGSIPTYASSIYDPSNGRAILYGDGL